ncbi:TonB-dependent receptor [Bacteroides sp.]|uniref:TonB-dependent receptor n=1 Tax=Bacteroides sp. TaxID=29523 RepID=UPI004028A8CD
MNRLTKIMFVLGFLLTSVWSYSSNSVYAQEQKFTFEFKQTSIKTIFQYIEKHSEFIFMYRADLLDTSKKVSVKVEKQAIEQILEQVLKGIPVVYEINDRQILLKKVEGKENASQQSGQKKLIQGLVKDEKGEVIIGATIKVKDTTIGTATDMNGLYNLTVPSENSVLVVSYIGYTTQEVKVGKQQNIIITLKEDQKTLEEVVVTAFGTGQKKVSVVGSVQTMRPSDLKVPSSNLTTSFAGRLAGVIAMQRTGEPGADGANFWIRGVSTLGSASTSPLIVIDGVEATAADLNALDPEVIEGFSILKDATATAMYGMRGANGVMIVTTKSGANLDKPVINFRVEGSLSTPTSIPEFVDGVRYMELFNEAVTNEPSGKMPYTKEKIEGTRQGLNPYIFPNVNWYDELFKDHAFNQMINFNIRGGGKKVDYFSSISVTHEEGMLRDRSREFFSYNNNINRMRYAFQNNINAKLGATSRLSLRLNVILVDKHSPSSTTAGLYNQVMYANPVATPVYYPDDGVTDYVKWGTVRAGAVQNPLAEMVRGYSDLFQSSVTASLNFDQDLKFITPGLKFKALASFKSLSTSTQNRVAPYNAFSLENYNRLDDGTYDFTLSRVGGEVLPVLKSTSSNTGNRQIYLQAMLEYGRVFGKHDVNALFIYNQDEYADNNPGTELLKALPKRRQGLAARASYMFDNRYMAEVNLGYNGSENFAKNNRFGFFPSFAIGYNIGEEKFFEPLKKIIPRMKIRVSYGLVGNDQVSDQRFLYMSDLNLTGSPSFTTGRNQEITLSGPLYKRFLNEDLTWEVGKKYNLGLDLTLWKNINLTFDVFREDRSQIFQALENIPYYSGVYGTKFYSNSAEVRNQGIDLSLDFGHQFNKDFSMTFKGTFTYAHNEIRKYDESYGDYPNLSKVGYSVSQQWGYISDYLFADQQEVDNSPTQLIGGTVGPGDIKYVNIPNAKGVYDNVIDKNDRVPIGDPTTPEIVYGFGPSFQWKGWDFSFFFQGVAKTSLIMSNLQPFGQEYSNNLQTFIANNHWSPDNQNIRAAYPRLTAIYSDNNAVASLFWLRDGDFLKLKNVEIGYTYKFMRFYLRGANLLTFSKFDLWDPEQGGGNGLKYPTQRVFNIGFQMTLNGKR